ncbi:class I fructose-bisphosphate aldolase [Desulfolutivibrio sulfoxidireducens]|uniref:class I fructose-bisphosphate aldolase n=1 Tax=Desulfolutivibrio sulfoxidireducens TaxID=2773299 RepID=UPI00159D0777|nr:fructose-bisphosphate aldolase [Desulfolutivibrio sulfoxidireducens]QLA16607.1 fructose-bisphosphate aldolase [Desulfolutivibrio sulfoxidireducens]QLA19511.1 fructose-bisphosphate aldolase [Desulfolutivibrio sulfoxidireducens]
MIGCARKLSRLFDSRSGRTVLVPLDHGVGEGVLPGIEDLPGLIGMIRDFPVQGLVLNKGALRAYLSEVPAAIRVAAQLSGGTRHAVPPYIRSLVCSVHEALRLGADLVAMQVNIANDLEDRMLADLGVVCDDAHGLGVPVLAVIQPKGDRIVNEMDPSLICHCIRLGAELGADMVGVPYSGDARSFSRACAASSAPVVITGGSCRPDFASFLGMVGQALEAGAAGTCVGRNVLQHHDPRQALGLLVDLVHGASAGETAGGGEPTTLS